MWGTEARDSELMCRSNEIQLEVGILYHDDAVTVRVSL
jgi:hypothetical protein